MVTYGLAKEQVKVLAFFEREILRRIMGTIRGMENFAVGTTKKYCMKS